MNYLTFDIETIPQEESEMTEAQKEELDKKYERALLREPNADKEELRNKIKGISPYFGKIIVIGIHKKTRSGIEKIALTGHEFKILNDFWKILEFYEGVFVSYNGLSFDVPFILKRSMAHEIKPTNKQFLTTRRYSKYPHADVKELISDWDRFAAPSLHLACDILGVPSPKEGEVKGSEVYQAYKQGRLDEIADYCIRDVEATFACLIKLQDYFN